MDIIDKHFLKETRKEIEQLLSQVKKLQREARASRSVDSYVLGVLNDAVSNNLKIMENLFVLTRRLNEKAK